MSGRRRVVVGIPLSATLLIGVPGKRLAITFSLINIFTCGFLQRDKHNLDTILKECFQTNTKLKHKEIF